MAVSLPEETLAIETYELGVNYLGSIEVKISDPGDPRIGQIKSLTLIHDEDPRASESLYFLYRGGEVEILNKELASLGLYYFEDGRMVRYEKEGTQCVFHWSEELQQMDEIQLYDASGELIYSQQLVFDEEGRIIEGTTNLPDQASGETPSTTQYLSYNEDGTLSGIWFDDGRYLWGNYNEGTGKLASFETPEFEIESQVDDEGNTTTLNVINKETGSIYGTYIVMLPPLCERPGPEQLRRQDPPSFFSLNTLWRAINAIASHLNEAVNEEINYCTETYKIVDNTYQVLDDVGSELLGPFFMRFFGFRQFQSCTGVYGEGLEPAKFRITFVNGILTTIEDMKCHMQLISEAHGGVDVHYCYVGSKGWTNDLVRSSFCKLGVISPEAKELAQIWRNRIQELGGTDSGGVIFHYAHSLGGTETHLAKFLLTAEELKMIRVITFGSPTLIPNEGFHSVMNLISCRDVISAFDPIGFFSALLFNTNSFFVGSHYDGPPIVDHPFFSYWTYLREHFWDEFEELIEELK